MHILYNLLNNYFTFKVLKVNQTLIQNYTLMKRTFLLTSIFIVHSFISAAQQTCEVKLKDIRGVYVGECKDDKANGKGKSTGVDEYEGDFKDGYPEGKGMYVWKDGHYFIGFFKKGNKEGQGEMYYESSKGEDSVITGYWKKDKYVGLYEKQFDVLSRTSRVNKVNCYLLDNKGEDITITVRKVTGGLQVISNITTVTGTFYSQNTQELTNTSVTKIQDVTFPFRAIFTLSSGDNVEILFNEKGDYDVTIDVI